MTDPLPCPECGGTGQDLSVPRYVLMCMCCYGRGVVGGPDDPEENPPASPPDPPPAWEHRVWKNPVVAAALSCRYCLDARRVTRIDEVARTLVTADCPVCA
ncbi:hypothetical protein GCM10017673_58420 [Streptosporangium violaceochromogenes]|nr:hypothetical protein GCM10017673_58420 [Streptosporangium violaceochromogenes]